MTWKKLLGYMLVILAALLSLSLLSQVPSAATEGFRLLKGELSSYQAGYFAGNIIGIALVLFLTIICWKYGFKFIKSNK